MKRLRINSLSVYSSKNNEGNIFTFSDNINVIESARNSLGKTTLINLIYWTLGCEIVFGQWQHCFCRVDFKIGGNNYSAFRTPNDVFYLQSPNDTLQEFAQLGEYQQALTKLWGVNIQLTNHQKEIKQARPAHFFATSYISQEKGWSEFFSPPFNHLTEFSSYKTPLVKQFTYKTPQYLIDLERDKLTIDDIITEKTNKNMVLEQTIATLCSCSEQNNLITEAEDYAKHLSELQIELDLLTLKRIETEKRLKIIRAEKVEMEADYQFALSQEDDIICDKCGTIHKNGLSENADLSAHAAALTHNETKYQTEKEYLIAQTSKLSQKIKELKALHPKQLEETIQLERESLIQAFTLQGISQIQTQLKQELETHQIEQENAKKQLSKAKRKNTKEQQIPNQLFISRLKHYADKLGFSLKYDKIKSPADYNKITTSLVAAGAADKNRSILAYYLAIYEMAAEYGSCDNLPPLVVDTPMQNDQDTTNYKSILDLLFTQANKQIFVCLINDGEILKTYSNLHRISLNKVLSTEKAPQAKNKFDAIL